MKKFFFLGIVSSFFLGIFSVQAAKITNLQILPADTTMLIQWAGLSDTTLLRQVEGYAVQWSIYQNKMRNADTETVRQFVNTARPEVSIRTGTFKDEIESGDPIFFRVYTYLRDGRKVVLTNGSDILKIVFARTGNTIQSTETIAPNDPVISEQTTTGGSDAPTFEFGKLRVKNELDVSADFLWSTPRVAASDLEGFLIAVSEKEDLSSPVAEAYVDRSITGIKVEGLKPATKYFARGYFYKTVGGEKKKFGDSAVEPFATSAAFADAQKSRYKRLLQQKIIQHPLFVVQTGTSNVGSSTTAPAAASTTSESSASSTTTNSSTTSSSSSTATSSTSSSSATNAAAVKAVNADAEKQQIIKEIKELQAKLKTLQARLTALNRKK